MPRPTPVRITDRRPGTIVLLGDVPRAAPPPFLAGVPSRQSAARKSANEAAMMGIGITALALVAVLSSGGGGGSGAARSSAGRAPVGRSQPSKPSARQKRKEAERSARERVKTAAATKRAAGKQKMKEERKDRRLAKLVALSPFHRLPDAD